MEKGIYLFAAFIVLKMVSCQKCPSYWYGYSSTSKCYRFMYYNKLSWQDARDICQLHGGDLLKIDSISERRWIFGQIAHLKNLSKIPSDKWWVGLNNREFLSTWEWADGSQIASSVVNWAPGEPNNKGGTERCGEINTNIFNDQECTDVNRYICSRNRGLPLACDTDHAWQTLNGQCYKVYPAKTNWNSANQRCQHDGGSMVTITSQNDETVMHDFAVNFKQQLWIGLHSVQQPGNTFRWTWSDNTPLFTTYWHGTPHVDRHHLNTSCVALSNTATTIQAWTVQPCSQTRAYVCNKPEGVCFPGWIGHAGSCYQFNAQFRQSFAGASTYCRNQGAELLRYTGSTTTLFINSYLQEMKDSGAGDFWIGASDNNTNGGPYKWRNGQAVTYKNWAHNPPANTADKQDCAYVSTGDKNGKWRITSNCGAQKSYICLIPMGATVKPIPRTPRPHYGCPSNWHRYGSICYRIYDQAVDWLTARSRCQQTGGGDLAAIRSQGAQNFVNHYAAPGIQYWIGLNDRIAEGVYVWNDENNPTTFTSWQPHQPNNYGQTQNCVVVVDGKWGDYPCSNKKRYVCYKSANSILPPQPAPTIAVDWTVKCGPGWESNPITANCYMFVDEPLSWIDALNQCQRFHGNLVAIETLEEQNYLAGRIQTMNSIGLWIGANDRSTEGGWRWSSGKPFAFLNWAGGQPAAKGQGTDCVVMFTQNAQWDDVNCIQRNGYVCEKVGKVPTTKAPATTTKKVPAGMVLGCRQGWKPYGKNCYYFGRTSYTWMDAYTRCGRLSAKLASIQSKNEMDFITGNLWKNPKKSWDGVWIGLNDRQSESRFQWSDGTDVKYTKWDVGEPNSWRNHNEDCVEVYLNNSNWNDELCTTRIGGYICKAPKLFVSATQSPYQVGCPRYAIGYESHCYRIITSLKTWTDANNYCNRTYHGTLATVNNRFIQGFLSSQLLYRTGYFWLGMSDSATPGTYTWASGDRVLYTNWHNTHTGNENATCVAMRADQPIGLWENLACTRKSGYICQLPRTSGFSTMPTTATPYPNVPCPTGWTAVQGNCYYAFTGKTQKLTWMNARTFCKSLGGELPSFHGGLNDSFLSTFLPTEGNPIYWIGINDRDTEAGYTWSDGTAVDYTNWMPEEPNNYKGNEDCAMYYTYYKKWNDMSCYTTQNYICVVPRGAQLPATTVIPPPSRSPQCGSNPNWYFYNNNCYMLNPTSGPNATLSWYDSKDYCNGINSHLASIHTNDENSFLEGLVNSLSLSSYWIGLNELGLNGYSWTDTTPVDFILWMRGEPNDYYGGERCVELYGLRGGRWNDDNCGRKRGYICKKPVSGQVIIPTAAPYPSGGCANGFSRVPGGRNKCFYMNTNKLNWTAARDHCREFGKGYDIASIEDIYEHDFFMSMAGSPKNNFWIGLTDRLNNNVFLWQDNSPVVFTHWDKGQPTSSHTQSKTKERDNCVVIRMYRRHEGKWADVDCSRNFPSLCQAKQDPNLPINPASGNCRSGYMPYGQGCYKISSDVKSWSDARAACQSEGGDLTSVNNIYESGFVYTLGSTKAPFWIGLSDSKTHGLYGWSDGWPVKFTNWGLRQPSYGTNGGCVIVNSNDRWDDVDCSKQQNYVCKIIAVRPPASTPPTPGNCSNPSWIPNGGYCYTAFVNNGRSWPEANYQCRKSGMELVSVHSKAEMDFVFNLVTQAKVTDPQNKPNIWLGLSKGAQGSFGWSDSSPVNYLFWNPGQPTGLGAHGQIEECVEFDRTGQKWNDVSCFTNRGYVCKAPKGGLAGPGSSAGQQQGNTGIGGSGLSGGSVAGIVLGIIVVIIFIAIVLIILSRKGVVKVPKFDGAAGFENKLYNIRNSFAKNDSDS